MGNDLLSETPVIEKQFLYLRYKLLARKITPKKANHFI